MKWLFKLPIPLYRLGMGFIVGRLFLVMTTIGRKSGQPRRTAVEFHEFQGRKYILSGWGTKTDWYRNIERNPHITIQTWHGTESVLARRITTDAELAEAFRFATSNPTMRMVMKSVGLNLTCEQFIAQKERFTFVTFDSSDQSTPAPLQADLAWVWAVILPFALFFSTRLVFQSAAQWLGKEAGYLLGFAFYWIIWCLMLSWLVVRKQGLTSLLRDHRRLFARENWSAALMWLVVTAVAILMYGEDFVTAPPMWILLAIPLATLNGFCEEILWRGLYVHAFPVNPWLGIVYPAFGFAMWHFAPQSLFPVENVISFVLSTLILGLAYGYIAYRTGSARWTVISHSMNGILALANPLASVLYSLIS
jgi:deazaflavin-dependent oxidoreductase (nitroreductase family)